MTSPIYNQETAELITRVSDSLPQALLLEGKMGVGLSTIAKAIAWRNLAGLIQPTNTDGQVDTSAKGIIRVPQIRELLVQTRGKFTTRQVYVIDEADKLNIQAQNAFLKLLEEPAPNIHFILTAHNASKLLPTVRSRVQRLVVKPVSTPDVKKLVKKLGVLEPRKEQQLLYLADGLPAELTRLISSDTYFASQAELIGDARTLIQGKPYQRTLVVSRYYSDRAKTLQLLEVTQTIILHSLATSPSTELVAAADRLATTYERILANGNTRLQLMNFVLQ